MRPTATPSATVDLRTESCEDAVEHVERSLGVRLDRETAVVKRRSVGARTDRGTWVRIETQRLADLGTRGWNGVETSSALADVAKPAWCRGLSWAEKRCGRMWRADETEYVLDLPVLAGGVLRTAPELPESWWSDFNRSLDALVQYRPAHPATRHTAFLTQHRMTSLITRVFGDDVDTTIDEWTAVHGDLAWQNLTAPECWFLDWEDWGAGPRGFDAACLWMCSLAVPALAQRIASERGADLSTRSGRVAWLYACAGILDLETDETFTEPARQQAQLLLEPRREW